MNRLKNQPDTSVYAKDFLANVVPWDYSGGYITIHWQRPGVKGFPGRSFQTIDAALQWIANLQDGPHANIYFCLSCQKLNSGKRSRDNALALQVVPVDIDVDPDDPKKYPTLAEAIANLFWFCDQLGIPRPSNLVASGGGLHAYWLSDQPLSVDEWQPYANALKTAFKNAGLKFDAVCTGDAARVLRVPGTINWKYDDGPRPVRLLKYGSGVRHDFAVVFKKILDKKTIPSGQLNKDPIPVAEAFKGKLDPQQSLGQGIEPLPPLPLEPILAECGWLREAYETGGKEFNEPQWYLTMLASTFLENGHELAHEFGNQHEGYTPESTEEKWDHANRAHKTKDIGWPQCKTIEAAGSKHCATCPHFAAGKSPINLGLLALQQRQPQPTVGLNSINAGLDDWNVSPRGWLLANIFCREYVASLLGDGGVGKTALRYVQYLALATGNL